jgi:outer membrane protein
LAAQEQDLIVRVVQAYLNILRAQDRLDTTNAEITAVKRQLEQVQQRFDVGLVAITDVLESQAAYDNAVVRGIQAEGDYAITYETLSTLTGQSYDALNRLSDALPIVNPDPFDEETWVSAAMSTNHGINSASAQLTAARRDIRAKQAGHLPTVDATVTQAQSVTGGQNFFGTDTTEQTIYGLQLTVPLYTGGLTRSRARQANATAERAQELLLSQQLNVTRDTRNLYKSVTTDVIRVRARLKAIRSAQSALEATQTGYEVGTRNIVDVLQAQQRLYSSQFDYADSRYNYLLNLMRLKQVAGTLDAEDLKELNSFMDPNDQVQRVVALRSVADQLN